MNAAKHDAGLPKSEPGSHRRDGKAQTAMPSHSFRQEVAENSRGFLLVVVGGLLAVCWGGSNLLSDGPVWQRVLGLIGALAGVLVWISYFLRFQPALIAGERWTRTRPRRALRAVLFHAWVVFFGLAVLVWLISLVVN